MNKVPTILALIGIFVAFLAGALAIPAKAAAYGHENAAPLSPQLAADGYVYVYEHINFSGASCRWFGDDADYRYNSNGCGNWNDRVSSAWNNGYNNAYPDVLFFENINYTGQSICLPNGAAWSSMPSGWNDRVSSHKWVNC